MWFRRRSRSATLRRGNRMGCSSPMAQAIRPQLTSRSNSCNRSLPPASRISASALAISCSAEHWASARSSWATGIAASTSRMDLTTRKVEVTAHNHGFAVAAAPGERHQTPYGIAEVSHICLNDQVVEGLQLSDTEGNLSAFSVQY